MSYTPERVYEMVGDVWQEFPSIPQPDRADAINEARNLVDRGWFDEYQIWGEHPTGPCIRFILFRRGSGRRSFGFDAMEKHGASQYGLGENNA